MVGLDVEHACEERVGSFFVAHVLLCVCVCVCIYVCACACVCLVFFLLCACKYLRTYIHTDIDIVGFDF